MTNKSRRKKYIRLIKRGGRPIKNSKSISSRKKINSKINFVTTINKISSRKEIESVITEINFVTTINKISSFLTVDLSTTGEIVNIPEYDESLRIMRDLRRKILRDTPILVDELIQLFPNNPYMMDLRIKLRQLDIMDLGVFLQILSDTKQLTKKIINHEHIIDEDIKQDIDDKMDSIDRHINIIIQLHKKLTEKVRKLLVEIKSNDQLYLKIKHFCDKVEPI
jgi:hypothetical protein